MSNERRSIVDDTQFANLFRSYVETGVRPFDPSSIAARAIRAGDAPRPQWLSLPPWQGRRVPLLVAIGLLLLAAAVAAVVGSPIWLESRPVPGAIAVWGQTLTGSHIKIIEPDGTRQSVIQVAGDIEVVDVAWAPDGTRLAYVAYGDATRLRVVESDGIGTQFIATGYGAAWPAWSPDGRQLAFIGSLDSTSAADPTPGLYVVDADGTDLTRLGGLDGLPPVEAIYGAAWAPDLSRIALATETAGAGEVSEIVLHVIELRTGDVQRVSAAPLLGSYAPSWSPDGSRLLYGVGALGETPGGIAIAERTASGWTEEVIVPNPYPSEPSSSPVWVDSDRFVFVRDAVMLMVANADGSGERQLARDRFFDAAPPCVAPDGSRAAVTLYSPSAQQPGPLEQLLLVSLDGNASPQRISTGVDGPLCAWQPSQP